MIWKEQEQKFSFNSCGRFSVALFELLTSYTSIHHHLKRVTFGIIVCLLYHINFSNFISLSYLPTYHINHYISLLLSCISNFPLLSFYILHHFFGSSYSIFSIFFSLVHYHNLTSFISHSCHFFLTLRISLLLFSLVINLLSEFPFFHLPSTLFLSSTSKSIFSTFFLSLFHPCLFPLHFQHPRLRRSSCIQLPAR